MSNIEVNSMSEEKGKHFIAAYISFSFINVLLRNI